MPPAINTILCTSGLLMIRIYMNIKNKPSIGRLQVNDPLTQELRHLFNKLDELQYYFDMEITYKQRIIDKLINDIETLRHQLQDKEREVHGLRKELDECVHNEEGNRQLINKLLSDISRYQNDIEWYKRTYEKRSLLGVLKDKLKH
jgi:predicted RNase H-like nuclease (RuvC/YqgF family)